MYRTDELQAALIAVELELLRRRADECLGSLHTFAEEFWDVVEPRHPFIDNWHIGCYCEHLEALTAKKINKVIFNVPPGTSKSMFVSVLYPAWRFAKLASTRVFGASYAEPLALRDSALCRAVIGSDKFQKMFPLRVRRGRDEQRKYETTAGGWRLTTTVNGRGTGEHPDIIIIDDPHNVKQSESDVERQQALDWYDGTLSSRGLMHDSERIIIMQRLHERDLTGHIMKSDNYKSWEHVILPMEYEASRSYPKSSLDIRDPRNKDGELLWPNVFTRKKVAELKLELGEYRTAGQLQQRPAPAGGGVFKTAGFRMWPTDKPLPIFTYILQSYDTAFTELEENDPTAMTAWGVFGYLEDTKHGKEPRTGAMLLECWEKWMDYPTLRQKMITDYKAGEYGGDDNDPGNKPRHVDRVLIEDKASGKSLVQDLRSLARVPVLPFNPGHSSKVARGHEASPHLEAGNMWLLESKVEKGKIIKWARPFVDHLEAFPNGEHFDYADTFTQAIIYLARTRHLTLPSVREEVDLEHDYHADKKVNPYG